MIGQGFCPGFFVPCSPQDGEIGNGYCCFPWVEVDHREVKAHCWSELCSDCSLKC